MNACVEIESTVETLTEGRKRHVLLTMAVNFDITLAKDASHEVKFQVNNL